MSTPREDEAELAALLADLDAGDELVHRHLWLIALFDWIRGDAHSSEAAVARVEQLLDALGEQHRARARWQAWWRALTDSVDGTALLSDYGFASRNAFVLGLSTGPARNNSTRPRWLRAAPTTSEEVSHWIERSRPSTPLGMAVIWSRTSS